MHRFRVLCTVVLVAIVFQSAIGCVAPPPAPSGDCFAAVDRHWPESSKAFAYKVVRRESGGNPMAKNKSSSATGCFQLMAIHAGRFSKLGFSWAQDRFNADVNCLVALDLYNEQGSNPWRLTR